MFESFLRVFQFRFCYCCQNAYEERKDEKKGIVSHFNNLSTFLSLSLSLSLSIQVYSFYFNVFTLSFSILFYLERRKNFRTICVVFWSLLVPIETSNTNRSHSPSLPLFSVHCLYFRKQNRRKECHINAPRTVNALKQLFQWEEREGRNIKWSKWNWWHQSKALRKWNWDGRKEKSVKNGWDWSVSYMEQSTKLRPFLYCSKKWSFQTRHARNVCTICALESATNRKAGSVEQ